MWESFAKISYPCGLVVVVEPLCMIKINSKGVIEKTAIEKRKTLVFSFENHYPYLPVIAIFVTWIYMKTFQFFWRENY